MAPCLYQGIKESGWIPGVRVLRRVEHVIDCFGWDRVMFGSDWPVCTLSASFQEWVEALCFLTRDTEESNCRKLFYENAERVYRLNQAAALQSRGHLLSLLLEEMNFMGRFTGKVAIVTGGGSGIGRATAQIFAEEGARVVLADINSASANEAADAIARDGGAALAAGCDISRETEVQRMISTSVERYGRIDVLVNSAARFLMKGGQDAGEKDWHEIFATNVAGTALCSRYAAEQMKQTGGGAIVILSSTSGMRADPGYATYSSSKAALLMLTRSLAIDFGAWNIRVNSVSPGAVNTPALRRELQRMNTSQEKFEAEMFRAQCLQRLLQPDDIARCILFLASDDARCVTGANLVVDAGYCAGK